MNIIIIIDVQPCSGKDEQAASSNPGGGSSTKETTPTDTPTAGESGSNSISKTAESSSNNAEPMEHWPLLFNTPGAYPELYMGGFY